MRDLVEIFSTNLRNRRIELNMSQKELADRVGVGPSAICNYEKANVYPALKIVVKLAEVLGVSIDWLCRDQEAPVFVEGSKGSGAEIATASLLFALDTVKGSRAEKDEESVKIVLPAKDEISREFWFRYSVQEIAREYGLSKTGIDEMLAAIMEKKEAE